MISSKIEIIESEEYNSFGEKIYNFVIDDIIWMSNYDDEVIDSKRSLQKASGNCYIGGLGLGIITMMAAKIPQIKSITVVEINKFVIAKTSLFIQDRLTKEEFSKIKIYRGNAMYDFFALENYYDWMYFDIWLEPDETAKKIYKECKQNAQPYLKKNGIFEAWLRERIE